MSSVVSSLLREPPRGRPARDTESLVDCSRASPACRFVGCCLTFVTGIGGFCATRRHSACFARRFASRRQHGRGCQRSRSRACRDGTAHRRVPEQPRTRRILPVPLGTSRTSPEPLSCGVVEIQARVDAGPVCGSGRHRAARRWLRLANPLTSHLVRSVAHRVLRSPDVQLCFRHANRRTTGRIDSRREYRRSTATGPQPETVTHTGCFEAFRYRLPDDERTFRYTVTLFKAKVSREARD